jgi:alpha-tubulin suppressor-like RCC1 family protein
MERKRKIRYGWTTVLIASLFLVVGCGSISGTVSSGGEPLAGVTVELEGPACATTKTTTDDCGNYRFPWVAKGNYTVTPSLTGYSFTPENQSVKMNKERHVTDVNFEGVPGIALYSISGTITAGVGTLSGLTVSIAGVTSASTTTDAGGNYRFVDLPGGGYTVTPSPIPGYGFTPADVTLNADMTVNFDATPNTLRAWGLGESGQLGNNQTADSPVPVPVVNLSRVIAVSGGVYHSLALLDDGAVRAWGQGTSGQLGSGAFEANPVASPVPVDTTRWAAGRRVTAIAAGGFHSLALLDDGTVWAWGLGVYGQLGNGANDDYPFPTAVSITWGADKKVVAVAACQDHSLALLDDGTVWAWGVGTSGQLGNGQFGISSVPVQVQGLTGITSIACGGYHSMAVGSGGTVWTWGDNIDGRLGWDTAGWPSSIPGRVTGLSGVISVAGGDYHSMAVTSTGTVWAWGLNTEGRLGVDPSSTAGGFSITPVAVTGLTGAVNVAAGSSHSVAGTSDGLVWIWGLNNHGQLGNGSTGSYEFNPTAVSGLSNIIKVAAGSSHTLAVKSP